LRIFGPKRDKVTAEWRRIHNKELYDLHSSNNFLVMKQKRWAGHVARMGYKKGVYRVLVGRLLGTPWLEDNIKTDIQHVVREGVEWTDVS
jgi:hypothetical protein